MRHSPYALATVTALLLGSASSLGAQRRSDPPPLEVSFAQSTQDPYRLEFTLRSTREQEVVMDRRLIQARVRASGTRRWRTCRHPSAPRRALEARTRTFAAGESASDFVDVRMLCWGRALAALQGPAEVELRYGFRSRSRRRFVARVAGERRAMHRSARVPLSWSGVAAQEPAGESDEPGLEVTMRPVSTRGSNPVFRVRVRGEGRAYLRDDLLSFTVDGPMGRVACVPRRQAISPIRDFFRPLRRGRRLVVDSRYYCPPDTFSAPGVYTVTPSIDLVYGGERFRLEARTGKFVGRPSTVRVWGRSYVDHGAGS